MIKQETIEKAVFELCRQANTILSDYAFDRIKTAYESESNSNAKHALSLILENAKLAAKKQMPLCQDTGVVIAFVKIPNKIETENLNLAINNGVKKAYSDCFFRKSIVKNAFFNR